MMPQKITELWAWIRMDDRGDGEGILASEMEIEGRTMFVPLVGADRERVESYRPIAMKLARAFKRPIKLVRFSEGVIVEEHHHDG